MSCCCSGGPKCCVRTGPASGGNVIAETITFDATIGETVELSSIEAKCGATQHDYDTTKVERWGTDETVLFCRNCGDVRKIDIPPR